MTIAGWIIIVFGWVVVIGTAIAFIAVNNRKWWVTTITIVLAIAICVGFYAVGRWYYTSTADGIRAMTDQKSNFTNGLERTITIYTANGDKIAEYHGKIDLEMDQDYVKFDWNGKRYIYYNCFVETIAELP